MTILIKEPLKKDQIANDIKSYIQSNRMPVGARLMSEKNLAAHFHVNHLTVRSALSILEGIGVIERRPGSGTYVKNIIMENSNGQAAVNDLVGMLVHTKGHLYEELKNDIFLQLYQRKMIAVVFPTDADGFADRIIGELIKLKEQGCNRLIINEGAFDDDLLSIILKHPDLGFPQVVQILGNTQKQTDMLVQRIMFDHSETFNIMVDYLKKLGHKRILLMIGRQDYDFVGQSNKKMVELFTQSMIHAGLAETMGVCIYTGDDDESKGRLKKILKSDNRPTAILGDIDWRGVEALKIIHELGLKAPDDISVMGIYNTPWAQNFNMTSVKYDLHGFAKMVVSALLSNTHNPIQLIEPQLVIRQTTSELL